METWQNEPESVYSTTFTFFVETLIPDLGSPKLLWRLFCQAPAPAFEPDPVASDTYPTQCEPVTSVETMITITQVHHQKPTVVPNLVEGVKKQQQFRFFMSPKTRAAFLQRYIQFPKQIPQFSRKALDDVWEKSPAVLPVLAGSASTK